MNLTNFEEIKKHVSSLENMRPIYHLNYLCSDCLSSEGRGWIVEEENKVMNTEVRYVGVCLKCRSSKTNFGVAVAVLYSDEEEYLCFDTYPIDAILEEMLHE